MQYISDVTVVSEVLGVRLEGPVYRCIGVDDNGDAVVVPAFIVQQRGDENGGT